MGLPSTLSAFGLCEPEKRLGLLHEAEDHRHLLRFAGGGEHLLRPAALTSPERLPHAVSADDVTEPTEMRQSPRGRTSARLNCTPHIYHRSWTQQPMKLRKLAPVLIERCC